MKPQYNTFRWIGLPFLVAVFISLNFLSRSVSAQEGTPSIPTATPTGTLVPETEEPPIATATPTDVVEESAFFPTVTPTAFTEETPLQPQGA